MADVRRAVREWAGNLEAKPGRSLFLVGLSGGGDSLALAWALSQEAKALGVQVGVVIVDHGLQEGSAEVAARAADQAGGFGLSPVLIKSVSVVGSGNIEEKARRVRYQAYNEALKETGAEGVVLAHSLDDQAETVLLGLTRGSGPTALKGMASLDGVFHRPLLELSRNTLRQALRDAGVPWWEDPHNTDERFTRPRVRHQVLPVLEKELGPGVAEALARTAELFRIDSAALDADAEDWFRRNAVEDSEGNWSAGVLELESLSHAIRSRVLRMLVMRVGGGSPSYAQTRQMMTLLQSWNGQSSVNLSGASLERTAGRIIAWKSN
jgi:tRNA(Ile)-lysidine synthase